ncbi:Flp family type IVb pilin [Desulfovibrio inopinatus]|uniref:Flp family type IVb pilin n=1 Tax=Desulfovibrio inopinatus TaxID=102109 RepID=UPI00040C0812|nr:hypothetical protein [Desulfovibrio inopinatus]
MITNIKAFFLEENGATTVEYTLLTALAISVVVGFASLASPKIEGVFNTIISSLSKAGIEQPLQ